MQNFRIISDDARRQYELANSLHRAGRLDEAIAAYGAVISISPDFVDAHFMLGNALAARGMNEKAGECFQKVLQLDPNHLDARVNVGMAMLHRRDAAGAVGMFQGVLKIRPDHFLACNNLAAGLNAMEKFDLAEQAARAALAMRPDYPRAHRNLADSFAGRGQWELAVASYRRANELEPVPNGRNSSAADARVRLAIALKHLGKTSEAISALQEAAKILPADLEPARFVAAMFVELDDLDDALAMAQQIICEHPKSARAFNSLGNVQLERGRVADAIDAFSRALQLEPSYASARSNKIFARMFDPASDPKQLLEEAKLCNVISSPDKVPPRSSNGRKLRIGYVSSSFYDHVIGRNILPLLRDRDRGKFEVVCYSGTKVRDAINQEFRDLADQWRDVAGKSADQIVLQICEDKIDILMDLAMHTAGNRLDVFALRPAPVQITFGAYPGTTGLSAMDYRLTDPYLDPPGDHDGDYSERSLPLRNSFWCYDPSAMGVDDLPEPGLPPVVSAGHITFGCMNNFRKVSDASLQLWASVMSRVLDSRLRLLAPRGNPRQELLARMEALGVAPGRISFVDRGSRQAYFDAYRSIDIVLDTIPYNGHTTSLDAF